MSYADISTLSETGKSYFRQGKVLFGSMCGKPDFDALVFVNIKNQVQNLSHLCPLVLYTNYVEKFIDVYILCQCCWSQNTD